MLEINLHLKGQMHQCKVGVLGRMNDNGNAKETETECHMWVDEFTGDIPDKVSVLCGKVKNCVSCYAYPMRFELLVESVVSSS